MITTYTDQEIAAIKQAARTQARDEMLELMEDSGDEIQAMQENIATIVEDLCKKIKSSEWWTATQTIERPFLVATQAAEDITAKPWGWERLWALSARYAAKLIHIHSGEELSLQYHEVKHETIFVIEGLLELELRRNGARAFIQLKPGETADIPPNTVHRMKSIGDDCVELIEVSTTELDDVIRLEDKYGRIDGVETPEDMDFSHLLGVALEIASRGELIRT